jgi:phosphatidylglycerophosphate synthase
MHNTPHASADGKFTFGHFLFRVAIAMAVGGVIIGACILGSIINKHLGVFLFGLSLVVVIVIMYLPMFLQSEDIRESVRESGGESDFATVLVGVVLCAIVFGLLCQALNEHYSAGFEGSDLTQWMSWVGFPIDILLEDIFFEIPGTYGFVFSDIEPTSFWMKFLLITFRVLIDIVILQSVFTIWSLVSERRREEKLLSEDSATE